MIMEYNNYYPRQSGHPPPVGMMEQHPMGPNSAMMQGGPPMVIPPPPVHHGPRQTLNLGPIQQAPMQSQQQQMTPLTQHMGHHMQPMIPQPQSNYHQMTSHPPLSHSASPHPPTPHSLSHTPTLNTQPPPRPSTGPSPQHPPSHHQSPIHMNGPPTQPPPHMQQPPSHHMIGQPPMNQILPPGVSPSPQPMMQPPPQNQGFMGPGPMPPQSSPHYNGPPPNHHQPPPPPPSSQMPPIHHAPQPPPPNYIAHVHSGMERSSPYNLHIPQTEFRIIEFNKRLQNRPRPRGAASPLPLIGSSDESIWWEKFVSDFFDDDSTLTLRVPADDRPTEYTIGRTLIPKFFRSYFEGGVVDLSIKLRNTREIAHNNSIIFECEQTDITTKNIFRPHTTNITMNVVVHTEGHLSIDFVNNSFDSLLIKSWRFYTHQCHEFIDRQQTMTTNGLPNAFLVEPVTRNGLTKSTIAYLKMCMIMEPMQVLMLQYQQTRLDPRSCLKNLLQVKYKFKSVEDNRAQPKRRKRKAPGTAGPAGQSKKTKANAANANALNDNNGVGFNNNLMSPATVSGVPNLSLASQDVLVVGEPSMLGADFGDENERRITRLENSQFDASVSNNQNNQNQTCSNPNDQTQSQTNNNTSSHMQQTNNHDTGGIQIMNLPNNQNNPNTLNNNGSNSSSNSSNAVNPHSGGINNNSSNNNNQSNDSTLSPSNNGNNCLQGNNNDNNSNNNITMNPIPMNGNVNHISHITKSELDLKQQSVAVTATTTVTSPANVES